MTAEATPPAGRRELVAATYVAWRDDRTMRLGAGLAYYGLFSLASVLAVALGLLRVIGQSEAVEAVLVERATALAGPDAADAVASFLVELDGSAGTQLGLIGLASLLVTGSVFFLALEDALNQIWHVPVAAGIRSSLRRRLTSLVVLLASAATLVIALGAQSATAFLGALLPGAVGESTALGSLLTSVLGTAVLAAALSLLFRFLPAIDPGRRAAVSSAVPTAVVLVVGTALVGWYLRTIGAGSLGGVASVPLAVLFWIYAEAQILLVGAQLSKVLARRPAGAAD